MKQANYLGYDITKVFMTSTGEMKESTWSLHVQSTQFRDKIFMATSDANNILQAYWVSLGSGIYETTFLWPLISEIPRSEPLLSFPQIFPCSNSPIFLQLWA